MNNNICVLPFNSVSIDGYGQARACCSSGLNAFNIYIDELDISDFINNKKIVELRESFLANETHPNCDRCWKMEEIGNSSFRHVSNKKLRYGLKNNNIISFEKTINFENIQYLDITLGNKCNLACRMCNGTSSSLLAKQLKELNMYSGDVSVEFSRSSKDKVLELIDRSKNLTSLYLLGGEPLINDFHDEIVELLVNTNRAKDIDIHYSSNMQIDIEKYLPMWKQFKFIDLNVSIDGSYKTYEYIRWPGKWEKLFKNLKRACDFSKETNFNPTIATTVQNLNAANMYDLINECSIINGVSLSFFFIPVTGGNFLELTPARILEEEITKLQTLPDPWGRITELIQSYRDALKKHEFITRTQVHDFFSIQRKFDKYRKQNLFLTHPHFIEMAEKFNVEMW